MKKETMTSRERVIRAINREPVDRVPIDLGSHMSTGISMTAYHELREYLGFDTSRIWIPDMVQGLAYVDEDVLERFHVDVILLEPRYRKMKPWNLRGKYTFAISATCDPVRNEAGEWIVSKGSETMRMPAGGYFFDGAWLSDWGEGSEDERIALYAKEAERIYKETDYATNFVGYSRGIGFRDFGAGNVEKVMMAYEDPDQLRAMQQEALEYNLRIAGKVIDSFGEYIQMMTFGDDIGTQNGLMCSPDYIRKYVLPYYKQVCDFVHANSDIKIFLHTCGSIRQMLPDLITAGIDIVNPVQITAADMDPRELKNEYGRDICFWGGGCNTQGVLGVKTPEEVTRNVCELMNIFKTGSGFVFNQVHNIMGNVPPENIVAMLDTAYEESFFD